MAGLALLVLMVVMIAAIAMATKPAVTAVVVVVVAVALVFVLVPALVLGGGCCLKPGVVCLFMFGWQHPTLARINVGLITFIESCA